MLLGVQAPVIKAHGSSNEEAIFNAIRQANKILTSNVVEEIANHFRSLS
ncbi:hypothetical protein [Globicatella sulfidifaciens]|nr:hypothetical protein [Globicatella sulfidifaciens]